MTVQTEDALSFIEALVYVSPDGVVWTDVSGHGARVTPGGGERSSGEQHTFGTDPDPIIKPGKRSARTVSVEFAYTETASDPFDVLKGIDDSQKGIMYLQYQVKPAGVWYYTPASVLTSLLYPGGEAGTGDIIMSEFVVKCANLIEAAASI